MPQNVEDRGNKNPDHETCGFCQCQAMAMRAFTLSNYLAKAIIIDGSYRWLRVVHSLSLLYEDFARARAGLRCGRLIRRAAVAPDLPPTRGAC